MLGSFTNSTAVVTGASRGIGRAIALRLGSQGVRVAVNYHRSVAAAEEVADLIRREGGTALAIQADVSRPEEAEHLICQAEQQLGPVHILVNNAGITRDRLVVQMSEEDWEATWCTDLVSTRAASRRAARLMRSRQYGRIVNLSSVVGVTGNAGQANYASAKSAVLGITRELAVELAPDGINVNCVVPGYIVTDATAHLSEEQRAAWIRRIPMLRQATVDDVAEAVCFFASPAAGYITGQCLSVDGGLVAAAGGWMSS